MNTMNVKLTALYTFLAAALISVVLCVVPQAAFASASETIDGGGFSKPNLG